MSERLLPVSSGIRFGTMEGDVDEYVHAFESSAAWKAEEGMMTSAKCGYTGYASLSTAQIHPAEHVCPACRVFTRVVR